MIPTLSPSSVMELVAPGSPVTHKQLEEAIRQVKALGFEPRPRVDFPAPQALPQRKKAPKAQSQSNPRAVSSTVFSETDPKQKFQQFQRALLAPDSQAVWCVRGGSGSQKLMPFLLRMKKPEKPKLVIGYSDITVLQVFLNLKWKWPVLHFPVLTHVRACSSPTLEHFKEWIMGVRKEHTFKGLELLNQGVLAHKSHKSTNGALSLKAPVTGGNLTLIQSAIGTAYAGDFQGKMLFLEETNEAPYRVDRALWHMQQAGVFKGVKVLLLGDFICPKNQKKEMEQVLASFAQGLSFPVLRGFPLGHGQKKEALPFMTPCELSLPVRGKAWLKVKGFCP